MTVREQAIVRLLERYHDLVDPVRAGKGNGTGGLLLMPHADHCAVTRSSPPRCTCELAAAVELERLLAVMRNQAKQQAYGGYALGTLRFHIVAWYVDVERVHSWHPKTVKRGKKMKLPSYQDVLRDASGKRVPAELRHHEPRRDPQARRDRAELGVQWLEQHWRESVPLGLVERDRVAA